MGDLKSKTEQYIGKYYCYFEEYTKDKLSLDVAQIMQGRGLSREDREDLHSELKLKWIQGITRYSESQIHHPRNLTFTICKNHLRNILSKLNGDRFAEHKYYSQIKGTLMSDAGRKQQSILLYLDDMPYIEVRELFNKHLTVRQKVVVFLRHSQHTFEEIAVALKLSSDYVRKIHAQAEKTLRQAVRSGC